MQIDTNELRQWVGDRQAAFKVFYKDDEKCKFAIDELCSDLTNLLDDYEDTEIKNMAEKIDKECEAAFSAVKARITPIDVILSGIRKVI